MVIEQTFEEAVNEFLQKTKEQIGQESPEQLPPPLPSPFDQAGPPFEAGFRLMDSRAIQRYTVGMGDDNPLYTDPKYGTHTRYGSQIAPGPALCWVRYPAVRGAQRPKGYPVANFFSGTAWEFYDVIRVGARFRSTKITKEIVEKQGSRGRLFFLVAETHYWDYHGDLPGKCYGTLTMVPQEAMGGTRTMNVERLGEKMLYERGIQEYNQEDIDELVAAIEQAPKRRGAETLYWEDVEVGEKLGSFVLPPWSHGDHAAPSIVSSAVNGGTDSGGYVPAFEPAYHRNRAQNEWRLNPATRWPWNDRGIEHDDALLAPYRGLPAPFDSGSQRTQIPQRLLSDWMGDDGFIRRMYTGMRRPVFYADSGRYEGEVVKKFTEVQTGEEGQGATPGKAKYYAVGIKIQGINQIGEVHLVGTATVYLPSREGGSIQLPVPHLARPPYVPYDTFYKDWY